jgi:broad specificity phosphatase PhoE
MADLALVKHSRPEIDAPLPPAQWRLSEEGRRLCRPLADDLRKLSPAAVVTSVEPKASETGALVAGYLGLPWEEAPALHEHERPFEGGVAAFEAPMVRFFAHPGERVYGAESADEAGRRFHASLTAVLERYAGKSLAVVAHGTVISLYVASVTGLDAAALWRRLGMPSCVVLSLPDLAVVRIVDGFDP